MITDIHSHISYPDYEGKILSFCYKDRHSDIFSSAPHISVGIHPWYITESDLDAQVDWIYGCLSETNRIVAIGECGLDKTCSTPMHIQEKAFAEMIDISESKGLPLIIHCVRAYNEIIGYRNKIRTSVPWIIHGFRGKKEMAGQLIRHGFYISIGEKFQPEAVSVIPEDRLLAETDESARDIDSIIADMAAVRHITGSKLRGIISDNTNLLFFNQ